MDGSAARARSTSTCDLAGSANGGAVRDDQSAGQRNLGGDRRLDRGDRVTDGPSRQGRRTGGSARQSAGIAAADRSAGGGAAIGFAGQKAVPGVPAGGGSFPRSFLIPGTDTSLRVGGFVDITSLYFLQGANSGNPGTPSSNSGQNGNMNGIPVGQVFIPGRGSVAASANHSRGNGVFMFSPQQSRLDIETRTPTPWGESRTFFA